MGNWLRPAAYSLRPLHASQVQGMKEILANFNKAFESRVRLGIMSVLAVSNSMDFTGLKERLP